MGKVNEAGDRRVKRTKRLLIGGLTKLMQEKSVKDISVRELAELIDINRGTFYLHYRDIFDMVEKVQEELFEEFYQTLHRFSPKNMGGNPLPMIEEVFSFVAVNADLCYVMLGPNGDMAFLERFKLLIKEKSLREWPEVFAVSKSDQFEYFYAFIVSGSIGLIYDWLNRGLVESPKEMAKIVTGMILSGVAVLK